MLFLNNLAFVAISSTSPGAKKTAELLKLVTGTNDTEEDTEKSNEEKEQDSINQVCIFSLQETCETLTTTSIGLAILSIRNGHATNFTPPPEY